MFAEQGYFQSTISQIAREAGVADGTIYLYFKNKDDILRQFFSDRAAEAFKRFRDRVDEADDAAAKLRNLIESHLECFYNDYDMAVVYHTETRQNSRLVEEEVKAMSKSYMDLVGEILEQGQEEGSIRRDLYLGLAKRFIMGAMDGIINAWIVSGGKYDLVEMADPLVELFMRGVAGAETPLPGVAEES